MSFKLQTALGSMMKSYIISLHPTQDVTQNVNNPSVQCIHAVWNSTRLSRLAKGVISHTAAVDRSFRQRLVTCPHR